MRTGAYALIPLVLALVLGVWIQWADEPGRPSDQRQHTPSQHAALSFKWMPGWLAEPIERAIVDAHDPRDRKQRH